MDYFSNTGANANNTNSTHPNQHDYDELLTIYAHLDSFTTIGFAAQRSPFTSGMEGDPSNWGQLVRQSRNGRSSTYEKVNWDGSESATQVYWTAEAAAICPACDQRYDH